jgi:hypothetical protein
MKVKIGNKIYSSDDEPIMVILSETEKQQISDMRPKDSKYCVFPGLRKWTKDNHKVIVEWMKTESIESVERNK